MSPASGSHRLLQKLVTMSLMIAYQVFRCKTVALPFLISTQQEKLAQTRVGAGCPIDQKLLYDLNSFDDEA